MMMVCKFSCRFMTQIPKILRKVDFNITLSCLTPYTLQFRDLFHLYSRNHYLFPLCLCFARQFRLFYAKRNLRTTRIRSEHNAWPCQFRIEYGHFGRSIPTHDCNSTMPTSDFYRLWNQFPQRGCCTSVMLFLFCFVSFRFPSPHRPFAIV